MGLLRFDPADSGIYGKLGEIDISEIASWAQLQIMLDIRGIAVDAVFMRIAFELCAIYPKLYSALCEEILDGDYLDRFLDDSGLLDAAYSVFCLEEFSRVVFNPTMSGSDALSFYRKRMADSRFKFDTSDKRLLFFKCAFRKNPADVIRFYDRRRYDADMKNGGEFGKWLHSEIARKAKTDSKYIKLLAAFEKDAHDSGNFMKFMR